MIHLPRVHVLASKFPESAAAQPHPRISSFGTSEENKYGYLGLCRVSADLEKILIIFCRHDFATFSFVNLIILIWFGS